MSQGANITPSRMNLALYKQKIIAAKKGHELLKRKCDALKAKFRQVMIALLNSKKQMSEEISNALLYFAKAVYAAGDFHQNVFDAVKRPTIRIDSSADNVAGVMLPIFNVRELEDSDGSLSQIGMDRGGAQIQKARECFKRLLTLLIEISSHQTSFVTLDQVIKITNRRVNALEHVVIPNFINIVAYINLELSEIDREEFYRIKKVLDNKRKIIEQEAIDKEKKMLELKEKGIKIDDDEQGGNLIDEVAKKDEDVLF